MKRSVIILFLILIPNLIQIYSINGISSQQTIDSFKNYNIAFNSPQIIAVDNNSGQIISLENFGIQIQQTDNKSVGFFDGSSYLTSNNFDLLRFKSGSISAWIKTGNNGTIFSISNSNSKNYFIKLGVANGFLEFEYLNYSLSLNNSGLISFSDSQIQQQTDSWHHLVWQSDGFRWSGSIDGVNFKNLNGSPQGQHIPSGNQWGQDGIWLGTLNSTLNTLTIGALNLGSKMTDFYDGYIENISISNSLDQTVLTSSNLSITNFSFDFFLMITLGFFMVIASIIVYKKIKRNNISHSQPFNQIKTVKMEKNNYKSVNSNYCFNCNSLVNSEDIFCQNCGERIAKN